MHEPCPARQSENRATSCVPCSGRLARLCERPAIVGRKFDPVHSGNARRMTECAKAQIAAMEEVFPAVTEIHRRDKIRLQAVLTGTVGDLYAFEADHCLSVLSGLQGLASVSVQLETVTSEHHLHTAD